ncbi:MAG TPA: PQQ-dependent dehydrogenase, methanol/ethanol family [Bryobacterales bacterium]|jgi:alcohol dehydrogenase (cytochrome c)|nr:PQQ-dependent dehydrogenase, methanol/ethanol family [Bryobacterales bacterium]
MKGLRLALCALLAAGSVYGQLTFERLLKADSEPQNWLTYSGSYRGWRYSKLDQINRQNVKNLKVAWVYQMPTTHRIEATPLVVDGVMYVSEPPSNVVALDPATGRQFWRYRRSLPSKVNVCCDQVNRGVAVLGDRVFVGTVDAHLVALSARTGAVLWDAEVADYRSGYSITVAPLVVKDMVITGIAGGEFGIRGFLDAYDARTGQRRWRFWTIPGPGEKGNETWSGDNWKHGGGPTWVTGAYDSAQNLIIWGTGNPSPDWNGDVRRGDNLYTDCAIAVDADTGTLRWYHQFVPHDVHDWDAVQVPVLVDSEWRGRQRKLVYWAHRSGLYEVLDRETGEFLFGKPFAKVTWMSGFDEKGRPIRNPGVDPTEEGVYVWPGVQGATNWYSPSYSPQTGLFYLTVWENKGFYQKGEADYKPGNLFIGSVPKIDVEEDPGYGAIRALNPKTGDKVWEYKVHTKPWSGVLSTAGKLVFGASGGWINRDEREESESSFYALDAESGKELWRINLGGNMSANPITYSVNGKQMVTMAAGSGIFTFALP